MMQSQCLYIGIIAAICLVLPWANAQDTPSPDTADRLEVLEVWGDRQTDSPATLYGVDAEDITAMAAEHPAEILNTLPGIHIQMNSGQENLVAIRSPVLTGGAGQGSFLFLENGVPIRSAPFGNVNTLFETIHESAEYIEVISGPASAKYGSNAVHGLINVILPEPGHSDSTYHGRLAHSDLNRTRFDMRFDTGIAGENSQMPAIAGGVSILTDQGWRDESGIDQQKLWLSSAFDMAGWEALAWSSFVNLNQETAGFIRGKKAYRDSMLARTNPNPEAFRDATSWRGAIRLERQVSDLLHIRITPFYRDQKMRFLQHFLPYQGLEENGHKGGGVMLRLGIGGGDGKIDAATTPLRMGMDLEMAEGYLRETQNRPSFGPFPTGVHYDYTVDAKMGAIWIEWENALGNGWHSLAGLRAEQHDYDYHTNIAPGISGRFQIAPNRSDSFSLFTPKLGIGYRTKNNSRFYIHYARGQRAPQASDLYRLQALQSVGDIKTETLDSLEMGGEIPLSLTPYGMPLKGQIALAAYSMHKTNFFFRDADGLNVPDGKTDHWGVEAHTHMQIEPVSGQSIRLDANISYGDHTYAFERIVGRAGETILNGNSVDTVPKWLADIKLAWQMPKGVELALSGEYIGEYFTNAENTASYPGHSVFHADMSWQVRPELKLYIRVRNLFDRAYADRADFAFGSERYFPGEPFNIGLGISGQF